MTQKTAAAISFNGSTEFGSQLSVGIDFFLDFIAYNLVLCIFLNLNTYIISSGKKCGGFDLVARNVIYCCFMKHSYRFVGVQTLRQMSEMEKELSHFRSLSNNGFTCVVLQLLKYLITEVAHEIDWEIEF